MLNIVCINGFSKKDIFSEIFAEDAAAVGHTYYVGIFHTLTRDTNDETVSEW